MYDIPAPRQLTRFHIERISATWFLVFTKKQYKNDSYALIEVIDSAQGKVINNLLQIGFNLKLF